MTKAQKKKVLTAQFIQIGVTNVKNKSDVYALDSGGQVWHLEHPQDSDLVEKGYWELLSNRRVISVILQDLFNVENKEIVNKNS
jgi:hypothetical protein